MKFLLRKPSYETVDYFIEMHKKWGHLVDGCAYIESRWDSWATFEDRFKIMWHKFSKYPNISSFIQTVYSCTEDIDSESSMPEAENRLWELICKVATFKYGRHFRLRDKLVLLLRHRYAHMVNVWDCVDMCEPPIGKTRVD
jgi:hypothetical protein